MSNSDVESLVEGLVASGALIMVIAIIVLSIAVYVLQAVALYKMANKLGHQYPWMAWIPYANTYLLFTLPDKKLKVLAFNKEVDRSTGFWIWLAITLGGSVIQGIFSAFTVIPVIGPIIVSLVPIAIMVARIFITYSAYKDLYEMFVDESQATPFAIVSIIVPITSVVFLLIASSKNPKPVVQVEENNGNYTYY